MIRVAFRGLQKSICSSHSRLLALPGRLAKSYGIGKETDSKKKINKKDMKKPG